MWLAILLCSLFFITKMEWAKFRYNRSDLIQKITESGQESPVFDTRQANGKSINYLKVGKNDSLPIIVLVHGSPGALNAYETYFTDTSFSIQANLIAVDRLGFGYSDFGKSVSSLALQAELIAEILKEYPDQKKVLVGHSMGGPVIARLAMDYPELVDGLVMVAPSISPDLEPSNRWRRVLDFPLIRWFTPSALRVCNQEIIPLKKELDQMMNSWEDVMIPVTIVQGEMDALVPMGNAFFAESMMDKNPNVKTTIIEGGNHFILWSEIPLIKNEILEVIKKTEKE